MLFRQLAAVFPEGCGVDPDSFPEVFRKIALGAELQPFADFMDTHICICE